MSRTVGVAVRHAGMSELRADVRVRQQTVQNEVREVESVDATVQTDDLSVHHLQQQSRARG